MRTFLLLEGIEQRLKEALKDWKMDDPSEPSGFKTPQIYIGQLPPRKGSRPGEHQKGSQNQSHYPYVIIVLTDGEGKATGSMRESFVSIGIISGIHVEESRDDYRHGVESILNLNDKIITTINDYRLWADNYYEHTQPVNYSLGLPQSIDPYSTGLQAEAPYFAVVAQTKFERKYQAAQLDTAINHQIGIPSWSNN
ncbi:hypothetical protein I2492_09395 [Budviciaceae bacterium CWB-B4]|uniref:Uncharacterized protein n=1 Tax=Limnobaculum xujianqingii TaxID=2738837 RepID=A0A9D7FTC6_9GAMM|nr:hypothetical protein [Limnobaculum xujianqingii]MBK5073229.1 hypothetical protein [Limnobaculum xujianqingii]MBK5176538.1 hypothetical protein [Limnobaculum xujianqingii]